MSSGHASETTMAQSLMPGKGCSIPVLWALRTTSCALASGAICMAVFSEHAKRCRICRNARKKSEMQPIKPLNTSAYEIRSPGLSAGILAPNLWPVFVLFW